MNSDDMLMILQWIKATEGKLGEAATRLLLRSMFGTQNVEPTIPMPPCHESTGAAGGSGKGILFIPPTPDGSERAQSAHGASDPRNTLTERETEILGYIQQGWSNKRIAIQFDLAEATVKVHMKAVLRKLRLANRTQAAIWAHTNLHA